MVEARKHSCWGYTDTEVFLRDTDSFIRRGIEAGERVVRIGVPSEIDDPGIVDMASEEFYGDPPCANPDEWLDRFQADFDKLLTEDVSGLRVIVDSTSVIDRVDKDRFVEWELRFGRAARSYPMTVVCAIRPDDLDKRKVADLVAVHDRLRGPIPVPLASVRLEGETVYLEGELDSTTIHLVEIALRSGAGDTRVDLSGVHFMDLSSIEFLHAYIDQAAKSGRTITTHNVPEVVQRCWDLLHGPT